MTFFLFILFYPNSVNFLLIEAQYSTLIHITAYDNLTEFLDSAGFF